MRVLIIAPHQDDEILAMGGLIQKCVKMNDIVTVLYATNGDYQGSEIARQRYYESINATMRLGISSDCLFYLGYGDTGMRYSHSFLRKLLLANRNVSFATPFSNATYHPAGKSTIHAMRTGVESPMTHESFLEDLIWFICQNKPDLIIIPHPSDRHGDHAAIYAFLQKTDLLKRIPFCLTYVIHGGNDISWPIRETTKFTCPPVISTEIWNNRICIPLSENEQQKKYQAICFFDTQLNSDSTDFLLSFSKQEEVFFLLGKNIANQQNIYNHFVCKETP